MHIRQTKVTLRVLLFFCSMLIVAGSLAQANDDNPYMADPSIFYYGGRYYLYGTGGGNRDDGFKVFTSVDLLHWNDAGYVLRKGEAFGSKGFWAPQVFAYKGKFYMAYTADEHIAIAVADHPAGPFRQKKIQPIPSETRMIDPFVFFDKGKIYMYHVRLDQGNRIFVAELNSDLSAIDASTLRECIHARDFWEDTQKVPWTVTEGPTVLKRRGWYYLLYSANDFRNPDYAMGYAVSKHPTGPWLKYSGNPVLSKKDVGTNGTGHGDVLKAKDGKWYYVFHTHFSNQTTGRRRTAIVEMNFSKQEKGAERIGIIPSTYRFLKTGK